MPNWCSNICTVNGTEEKVNAFFKALEKLQKQEEETNQGQIFPGIKYPERTHIWMFEITSDPDTYSFCYNSKWAPIVESMKLASEYFDVSIQVQYEEEGMMIYGQMEIEAGEILYDVSLDDDEFLEYDDNKDCT